MDHEDCQQILRSDTRQGASYRAEDAHVCGALGCRATEDLRHYRDGNGRERVLCRSCGKDFLGITT